MENFSWIGWALVAVGLLIAGVGAVVLLAPHVPWLGRLPGDIAVERGNVRLYFPIMTCIVVSVLLSVILWAVRLFSR
jgi:hypothetical protein